MNTIWIRRANFIFLFCFCATLGASEIVNFKNPDKNKNVTFFLSTPKSGTNLITGSLLAITRKPISWFYWGNTILDTDSGHRDHPSYNRLGLPLISEVPLLYRTHYEFDELMQVPSKLNRLIFLTRNPKELMYRRYFLQEPTRPDPDNQFIEEFLQEYLETFHVYDSWFSDNRRLVFYEDYIEQGDSILLDLLHFMNEPPLFFEDYLNHKDEYISLLLKSYAKQHTHNNGGSSSQGGPKPIYYTQNASLETLRWIDGYLQNNEPTIWEKYLIRFKELE